MKKHLILASRVLAVLVALAFLAGYVAYALGHLDPAYLPWNAKNYRPLPEQAPSEMRLIAVVWGFGDDEFNVGQPVSTIKRQDLVLNIQSICFEIKRLLMMITVIMMVVPFH